MSEISELLRKARWYVEVYDTPEDNPEQAAVLADIDAALARAEANAGEPVGAGEENPFHTMSREEAEAEGRALAADDDEAVADLLDEGLEILNGIFDSIKRLGNYSPEATCTFIDQAVSALTAAKPQPSGPVEALGDEIREVIDDLHYWSERLADIRQPGGQSALKHAANILSALTARKPEQAVPSGWQTVPKKLTPEMCSLVSDLAGNELCWDADGKTLQNVWDKLLSAAPAPKEER